MAGVREREDANRTREAGHLDEIQGVVANTLTLHRAGVVGFIDWLRLMLAMPDAAWAETRCHGYSVLMLLEQSRRLHTPARRKGLS
jgi:hypothetical protein